jgi:L-cysteine/cystine lyase
MSEEYQANAIIGEHKEGFGAMELVESIRSQLPALRNTVFMNTGGAGPLPLAAMEEIRRQQVFELETGRMGKEALGRRRLLMEGLRGQIAGLLHAQPEEIAVTRSTTDGINLVVWGMSWNAGDEVITSDAEHPALLLPLFLLRDREAVRIKTAPSAPDPVEAVASRITARTRLIALSHVSFSSGAVLPVKELIRLAHQHGVPVLLDGAQSAGAIPLDVRDLDVDYYSIPGQKWLCGPQGTGALFIRKDRREEIRPLFVGYGSVGEFRYSGEYRFHDDMRRFEGALPYMPALAGLQASLGWIREEVGLEWAYRRIQELNELLRKELARISGISLATPLAAAGLTSFRAEGLQPAAVVESLEKQGISIRVINELNSVRASVSFFNTEEEVERLLDSCRHLK